MSFLKYIISLFSFNIKLSSSEFIFFSFSLSPNPSKIFSSSLSSSSIIFFLFLSESFIIPSFFSFSSSDLISEDFSELILSFISSGLIFNSLPLPVDLSEFLFSFFFLF
ncbi:unnamed protein product [Meloidogyne enterolobii]|uniref:Uncharacterized protein n=1 Tax=Meloidogyne enterolobii TaxID=390850 RepID=A0ACB0YAK1_MELEN